MADNEQHSPLFSEIDDPHEIDHVALIMDEANNAHVAHSNGLHRLHDLAEGSSADEDMGEVLEDDSVDSDINMKNSRITSIFGGPSNDMDKDGESPKTSDTSMGIRMTILSLDHQDGENGVYSHFPQKNNNSNPNFDMVQNTESDRLSPGSSYEDGSGNHTDTITYSEDPVESYGLRRNIDRLGVKSTHIDEDESGNFDPTKESREKSSRAAFTKRMKRAQQAKYDDDDRNNKPNKKGKYVPGSTQDVKFKRIVKLPIKAMGSVLNITDGKDNWPLNHSVTNSEDEAERQELLALYREPLSSSLRAHHTPIPDPADEEDDLTGHPEARGCKRCRLQHNKCSMMVNGLYPCINCQSGEMECQPIVEAALTIRCERCEQLGQPCSFESEQENAQDSVSQGASARSQAVCSGCLQAGALYCKTTLLKRYNTNRIDLDEILYSKNRNWKDCTHCRERKKRCSLKKNSDKPPCKQCVQEKIGCHFYDVTSHDDPKLMGKKKKRSHKEQVTDENANKPKPTLLEEVAPECSTLSSTFFSVEDISYMRHGKLSENDETEELEPEEPLMMTDTAGHYGLSTKIKTAFAHPMTFSVGPDNNLGSVTDCNFCKIPVFGMVGHFEREVAVIQWDNGLGYTEIMNGHREEHGSTTMCQVCTFHRLQIIVCPGHRLQEIMAEDGLDYDAAAEDLIAADEGTAAMQQQLQRWCSMCFSLATHMCCTSQSPISSNDDEDAETELEGCGLRLCHECAHKLDQVYEYNLDSMATVFDESPKPREKEENDEVEDGASTEAKEQGFVRADVGLLRTDGLLMRCVANMED